jgi:hypothetical protein
MSSKNEGPGRGDKPRRRAGYNGTETANVSRLDPRNKFFRDAKGAFELVAVNPLDMIGLIEASMRGDSDATRIARAVAQALGVAARGDMQCLNPDHEVDFCPNHLPALFVIAKAFAADLGMHMVNGLCRECAAKDDVLEIILRAWRKVIPDLRVEKGDVQ